MKKLILSAIAASLILPGLLGAQDFPALQGPQQFTPPNMHQLPSWNVKEQEVVIDKEPLKGQSYSLIPWSELEPEEWLSIDKWLEERKVKDQNPAWKLRLRDASQLELVGKVLQCAGTCSVFRGTMPAKVGHLSRIVEGDELHTEKNTVAWVFLMDGTLVRVGPESSISFQEIILSPKQVFYLVRLNHGHVYWHAVQDKDYPLTDGPETDSVSLPLKLGAANEEHFQRLLFNSQTDQQNVAAVMNLDEEAVKLQIERINELRKKNNQAQNITAKVMLVAPNATIMGTQTSFDFVATLGGPAWVKRRSEGSELMIHFRGHLNTETTLIDSGWLEIDASGRYVFQLNDPPGRLQVLELLTKRIKTMELAREIWRGQFTLPVMADLNDQKKLAINHGYALWGEELNQRIAYLTEYTRRIETTNLTSVRKLLEKQRNEGVKITLGINPEWYQYSLNHYLLGLKSKYDIKKNQVREMSDLQYYVWTLKNGRW